MRHQKNHLLLGIFVISGITLVGAAIVLLGAQTAFKKGVIMESYFTEPVTGLDEGSPVRFRGVPAGQVTEITTTRAAYHQGSDNYALVRVEVYPEVLGIPADAHFPTFLKDRIEHGLRVQLTKTNITGSVHVRAIYLSPTDQEKEEKLSFPWRPRFHYVPSATSALESFKVSLEAVLEKLKHADIVGVVDAARRAFDRIDHALENTDAPGLVKKAHDTLDELQTELASIGDKARTTLDKAENTLHRFDNLLEKPELHKAIANAQDATAEFQKLVQHTNRTVLVIQRAVTTRNRDLAAITDGLRELVDNLTSLSGMLERHPSLAVFGKSPKATPVDAATTTKEPQK